MVIAQYGLGFGAGVLSLLAPCVLPIIPIIFGSSIQSSKLGPIANALGLTFSFTLIGILTSLFTSVFDLGSIQKIGAILLVVIGIIFLIPKLKDLLSQKLSFIGHGGSQIQSKIKGNGLGSHFLMGSVLGMIWGPCSGPTLAFAFGIATQAEHSIHATFIFFFFGLGAGLGLVTLGLLLKSSKTLMILLLRHTKLMNTITGSISIFIGLLILLNKLSTIEEFLLDLMPQWLIRLSVLL